MKSVTYVSENADTIICKEFYHERSYKSKVKFSSRDCKGEKKTSLIEKNLNI